MTVCAEGAQLPPSREPTRQFGCLPDRKASFTSMVDKSPPKSRLIDRQNLFKHLLSTYKNKHLQDIFA